MRALKKVYRIKDLRTGDYISLGYNPKSSWMVFPSEAIKHASFKLYDKKRYAIDVYETRLVETLDLDGNKLEEE